MSESVEDWIVREARAISGPTTHLQDSEALIQFGLSVAQHLRASSPATPQLESSMPMMSGDEVLVRELKDWLDTTQRDGGGIVAAEGLIRRVIPVLSSYGGAKLRAYRQARVFEPSMDGYCGAMATYSAAFGKPEGEIGVLTTEGEKQPWEMGAASPAPPAWAQVIERWREEARRYRDLAIQSEADSVTAPPFERGVAFGRGLCAKELEALADVARLPASQEEKK